MIKKRVIYTPRKLTLIRKMMVWKIYLPSNMAISESTRLYVKFRRVKWPPAAPPHGSPPDFDVRRSATLSSKHGIEELPTEAGALIPGQHAFRGR